MKYKIPTDVFRRFVAIWRADFLWYFLKEKDTKATWIFWFFWNMIIGLFLGGILSWALWGASLYGYRFVQSDEMPDFDIQFENQKLVHTGLDDPFRINLSEDMALIIDLDGDKYDKSSLRVFFSAIIVNEDRILIGNRDEIQEFIFSWYPELKNFRYTKENFIEDIQPILPKLKGWIIISLLFSSVFVFCFIRLLTLLWWSLLCWLLGHIFQIKGLTFKKTYFYMMNISFIPIIVSIVLFKVLLGFPLLVLILYALISGMHFFEVKERD